MEINRSSRIVITGAAGFIGSVLTGFANRQGFSELILVDDFSPEEKQANFNSKQYAGLVNREDFFRWATDNRIDAVLHIGARTDTTEFNQEIFNKLNVSYSRHVWTLCTEREIPLIYASSAATYGAGEHGYEDDHRLVGDLQPLNPYGRSKQQFDRWVLGQHAAPPFWAGLKFFNVYGPNEYHKGRMASVVYHAYRQISETGQMQLFRSHHPDFEDGRQMRDFIYVVDVVDAIWYLLKNQSVSGIFNLGTGKAQTFLELAHAVFGALDLRPAIEFIDTPEDIRDKYQYFTEANMHKLRNAGYDKPFRSLGEAVPEYVQQYLVPGKYY